MNDGYGTLPEWRTIHFIFWIKGRPHKSKTDESVDVEHDQPQDSNPQ